MHTENQAVRTYPPFWLRLSVTMGNLLQLAGLIVGSLVIYQASNPVPGPFLQVGFMLIGAFMIYICGHSLGHWMVGRLVVIRFQGYGIRGTNHPEDLSPLMRQFLTRLPMFTAMTEKSSMAKASPLAKALMFAAGETSTIICVLLIGLYAWQASIPGGILWLITAMLLSISAIVSTSQMPTGDYARAIKAWRGRSTDQGSVTTPH